jgi:hypothetical protein
VNRRDLQVLAAANGTPSVRLGAGRKTISLATSHCQSQKIGAKNNPPQQFAEVVPGGTQQGVDSVAFGSGQVVTVQAVIALQVPDRWLDGRPPFEHPAYCPCGSIGNREDHVEAGRALVAVLAIALVHHHIVGRLAGVLIEQWCQTCNTIRPHNSLGYRAPGTGGAPVLFVCSGVSSANEQGWSVGSANRNMSTCHVPGERVGSESLCPGRNRIRDSSQCFVHE